MNNYKIKNNQLLERCKNDRINVFGNFEKMPVEKQLNIDLMVKFTYLLINSIGYRKSYDIVFIDEVKNRSMQDNLHATENHCIKDYSVINLREINSGNHCKIGIIIPVLLLLKSWLYLVIEFVIAVLAGRQKAMEKSLLYIMRNFQFYLKLLYHREPVMLYCMTDRNFFSTIACNDKHFISHVIQHGLILGLDYYRNGIADYFLAWGNRSREIMNEGDKIIVTGTYKFEKLSEASKKEYNRSNRILYCVSISDMNLVAHKIDMLLSALDGTEYKLGVKMHPGSLFSAKNLMTKYEDKGVAFYKECLITDIEFDMAVIENSTILIDLICLKKPFAIYDQNIGYFERYSDSLIWIRSDNELKEKLKLINSHDFSRIDSLIDKEELNGGSCTIWD